MSRQLVGYLAFPREGLEQDLQETLSPSKPLCRYCFVSGVMLGDIDIAGLFGISVRHHCAVLRFGHRLEDQSRGSLNRHHFLWAPLAGGDVFAGRSFGRLPAAPCLALCMKALPGVVSDPCLAGALVFSYAARLPDIVKTEIVLFHHGFKLVREQPRLCHHLASGRLRHDRVVHYNSEVELAQMQVSCR